MNPMQDFGTGPGGGMMAGKWTNKVNGSTIMVRDCIMQGDEMIVITDRGQISGEDFSRNYIQMSDEEYDMKGNVIGKFSAQPQKQAVNSTHVQPKMFDDPQQSTPVQPINEQPYISEFDYPLSGQVVESESIKLIKKLFSKTETKPEITVDIKWADFPKSELNMLMNVFDVSKEDIANYMRTYLDDEEIKISIGKFIEKML